MTSIKTPCILLKAKDIQLNAKQLGFDWGSPEPVFEKVSEELDEVKHAREHKHQKDIEEELGDLLFAVVNLCRHLDVCPQHALSIANHKFNMRFDKVLNLAKARNLVLKDLSLETLDVLWNEIKQT